VKIALIAPYFKEAFGYFMYYTLKRMRHTVHVFDPRRALIIRNNVFPNILKRIFRKQMLIRLKLFLKKFQPDLTIVLKGEMFRATDVDVMRTFTKKFVINWLTDEAHVLLDEAYMFSLCAYDRVFLKDRYLVNEFDKFLKGKAIHLPLCYNEIFQGKLRLPEKFIRKYSANLIFVGSMRKNRQELLMPVFPLGLKIYGPGWETLPGFHRVKEHIIPMKVHTFKKTGIFMCSKIVMNIHHIAEYSGVNGRLFEACGCGSFQLVDYREEIPYYFEPDKEIVTFKTREEMLDKIRFYLEHSTSRKKIAQQGYIKAYKAHRMSHRIKKLFKVLKIGNI